MEDIFLEFLQEKGISMNKSCEEYGTVYAGIFELTEKTAVRFGILFFDTKDEYLRYQIVFENITKYEDKTMALQKVNELNLQGQGYYYLCVNIDGSVILRTIGIAKKYEEVYQIFVAGAKTAKSLLSLCMI